MGGVGSACERLRGKAGASCSSVCESIVDLKPGASCSSVCEVGAEERLDRSLAHRCPLLASPLGGPHGVNIPKQSQHDGGPRRVREYDLKNSTLDRMVVVKGLKYQSI